MAETAGQVIKSALQEILVQASEAPFEPDEIQDALQYMNRYMAMMEAKGVALGYTVVDAIDDEITIPDGALLGLVVNLAKYLAPQFDRPPPPRENIIQAESAMYLLAVKTQPSQFPGTVPLGSGNEQDFHNSTHFYPEGDTQILNQADNPILAEESTGE